MTVANYSNLPAHESARFRLVAGTKILASTARSGPGLQAKTLGVSMSSSASSKIGVDSADNTAAPTTAAENRIVDLQRFEQGQTRTGQRVTSVHELTRIIEQTKQTEQDCHDGPNTPASGT